jgi:hypothetical protein
MTQDMSRAIVLKDTEGHYYVVPGEVLTEARVPDEAKAAVDEDLGETTGFGWDAFEFMGSIAPSPERVQSVYGSPRAWPDFAQDQ